MGLFNVSLHPLRNCIGASEIMVRQDGKAGIMGAITLTAHLRFVKNYQAVGAQRGALGTLLQTKAAIALSAAQPALTARLAWKKRRIVDNAAKCGSDLT
jgi:hypothetical protein